MGRSGSDDRFRLPRTSETLSAFGVIGVKLDLSSSDSGQLISEWKLSSGDMSVAKRKAQQDRVTSTPFDEPGKTSCSKARKELVLARRESGVVGLGDGSNGQALPGMWAALPSQQLGRCFLPRVVRPFRKNKMWG